MKTIIAGSRTATRYEDLLHAISQCGWKVTEVVSGGARGVDSMGEIYARDHKLPLHRFIPDWDKWGKKAGVIRNFQMAENAQALIAIWDGESRGTENMIKQARFAGLKVFVYRTTPKTDFN